ncbi:hypothetical protein [Streptomyces botrytidirepellens]|uniref:hypothetical protein n=1 Tax=Streptomyces botrytidirepellens TaxID=2486417 RepID=UPI00161A9CBB|nr:hypothetical protein [Streptomyces botrytidirepellens]
MDPYGTLKLGSREMGQFISEINAEFSRTEEHGVQEILQGVLRLARECQDRDEMELRLDGD